MAARIPSVQKDTQSAAAQALSVLAALAASSARRGS